jgi:acetaldehyde dehydrogenase/alcohol dehydrogenase
MLSALARKHVRRCPIGISSARFISKDSVETVQVKIAELCAAQREFATFDQEKVDKIFASVAHAAAKNRILLARLAVDETDMGCFEDKVIKNSICAELTLSKYKNAKTAGIIERDVVKKITKIAIPVGPVAALIPVTNPTSTVITKALFALKTRNAMIFLPHPRSPQCTAEAVRICNDAAVAAGAPHGVLQCVYPTKEISALVMKHPDIKMILATGGPQMVHASYESGKPALGVGAGNAGVIIDNTADVDEAVGLIMASKTFDNGVICACEQSVVICDSVYDRARAAFIRRGMFICEGEDRKKLSDYFFPNGSMNKDVVGQSAIKIAKAAGIDVPAGTLVLGAECTEVGLTEPLSAEKLSPILSMYRGKDFDELCAITKSIVSYGGLGHTAAIYTKDHARLERFAVEMPAFHLMANMPTSLGAVGTAFNFNVNPSMTLGVGSLGGSSLSDCLTPFHLLNIKVMAERQEHMEWLKTPPSVYFNKNCLADGLQDLAEKSANCKRVLLVTDRPMVTMGYASRVTDVLDELGIQWEIFDAVCPDPDMACIRAGIKICEEFLPDTLICLGGGSPMDAGKLIRVMYEHPDVSLDDLSARFVELRKRTMEFPDHGSKIHKLVCIPTTSGTASEVTPFSVITSDTGRKHPLFSYHMTPDIAIIDSSFTEKLPKKLVAHAGLDAITHAVESYVSVVANDFTMAQSMQAVKLLFANLHESYASGSEGSREKVHHASTIAGLAFSNAFLGISHSLGHQIGAKYHLPHGITVAALLPHVIAYNASERPTRMAYYPGYTHTMGAERYADMARMLGLKGDTKHELVEAFITHFQGLCASLNVSLAFKDYGIDEAEYMEGIGVMADHAFDDQCTGANPRLPVKEELVELLRRAYYGV